MNQDMTDNNHGYQEEIEYGGFWIRFAAALIDTLIFIPIMVISFYNLFTLKSVVLLYILTLLTSIYKPLMEWRYGATLGKMACKIKVVNENQEFISLDQAFGRYIPWAISVIITLMSSTRMYLSAEFQNLNTYMDLTAFSQNDPLNTISTIYSLIFLIIVGSLIFDKHKRGFHDKIAKTMVIKVSKN